VQFYVVHDIEAKPVEHAIGEEIASMAADLRRNATEVGVLFFRVEIGEETFRVDGTDRGKSLPLGDQVLIR
jgi:hypothetical protein